MKVLKFSRMYEDLNKKICQTEQMMNFEYHKGLTVKMNLKSSGYLLVNNKMLRIMIGQM